MASLQCGLECASSVCMMLWMPIHTLLEDTEINKKGINLMTKSNRVTIRYDVQHGLNLCAGEILWSGGRSRGRPNPAYIVYMFNMTRPTGWGKNGDCPLAHHIVLMSAAPLSTFTPEGLLGLILDLLSMCRWYNKIHTVCVFITELWDNSH